MILGDAEAQVELAPATGGAIASFRLRGRDVLRATPPDARTAGDVRRHACYPLVPYSNRIARATLRARSGATFALARNFGDHPHAIHGIGWQRPWSVAACDPREATLGLEHRPRGGADPGWPFAFAARQHLALRATSRTATLTMTLSIENTGKAAFPFGLGWHPFFPRSAGTLLGFEAAGVWRNDDTQLPQRWEATPADLSFAPPRALGDELVDNVFTGWRGRAELRGGPVEVRLEADGALAWLVVYAPPGRDFLAIEPVSQMTDAFNRDARGERDTGTRELPPGSSWCCTMRIVATLAPTDE
jgi:aldose 1-epimerase